MIGVCALSSFHITTLVYVWLVSGVGRLDGIDWLWLGLAVVIDAFNTASAVYANRNRMPGYQGTTTPPPQQ